MQEEPARNVNRVHIHVYGHAHHESATYSQRVSDLDRKLSGLVLRESPESVLRADRERR